MNLYILFVFVLFLFWATAFYFWSKSEKKNKVLGFLVFGPWVFVEKDSKRDLSKRELFGWILVFLFIVVAIVFNL
ncbi:MAG: hypothetical protein A3G96_01560 [Gammaproteobacteria bacterium RIFCSPLOWO2_12_FULL_52_10]|nr:MAG: hypothetical protein A3G96_01560 [Gammaproteobacteria bacterium RIFCSPLOWO2_12_FULL_52_10]